MTGCLQRDERRRPGLVGCQGKTRQHACLLAVGGKVHALFDIALRRLQQRLQAGVSGLAWSRRHFADRLSGPISRSMCPATPSASKRRSSKPETVHEVFQGCLRPENGFSCPNEVPAGASRSTKRWLPSTTWIHAMTRPSITRGARLDAVTARSSGLSRSPRFLRAGRRGFRALRRDLPAPLASTACSRLCLR